MSSAANGEPFVVRTDRHIQPHMLPSRRDWHAHTRMKVFAKSLTLLVAALAMAMAMAGLGLGLAHADGNQTCMPPQWVT